MASAAGGSGAGGGDRCPSGEKGTTRVGRRSKKPSSFHRAALRYLEKNIENAWQGARNLRLILRIYCGVIWKNNIENAWQGARKTYVLLSEFLSFMYSTPLLSSVMD